MSQDDLSAESLPARRDVATVTIALYCTLGFALCVSRLVGLGRSFWHDEIVTVTDFVRAGPREILFGDYIPNNHELFSLLGWATTSVFSESETALRLWSVIPFIVGVAVVTGWLHLRIGALTALLYLFFTTLSPLLLDLSRQARGYGLAFLAMSVMIVAACEADRNRTRRSRAIATFCAAGLVGTLTLPIFGIAFLTTGVVLATDPSLRRRVVLGTTGSALAIVVWYAPHLDDLLTSSQQQFGERISWAGIFIAPVEQVLLPAFLPTDEVGVASTFAELVVVAAGMLLLASSPLLRGRVGVLLSSGALMTLVFVWLLRLYLSPRFVSFLLVPLLVFLSSGMGRLLAGSGVRWPVTRAAAALIVLLIATVSAPSAVNIVRLPREAHKDAARVIRERTPSTTPVFAHTLRPMDLAFYLDTRVSMPGPVELVSQVCDSSQSVVLVVQPFLVTRVRVPCLRRPGIRHDRFRQYSRGNEINVWFVPTAR